MVPKMVITSRNAPQARLARKKVDRRVPLVADRARQRHREQEEQIAADHVERQSRQLVLGKTKFGAFIAP